jgi:tetratricopeptide (TPR) repeat protein
LGESAYPEAEVEFAKELAIQPNDSLSYTQLGSIALSRRKFRDAEIALNHAARLNPRNPDIFLLLGQLYGETGRPADAESALRKAIAKTTDPARNHYDVRRAHYRLGRLLIQNGNAEEGRKEMQIAEALLVKSRLLAESDLTGNPIIEAPLQKPHDAPPADIAAVKAFENRVAPLIARSYSSLGLIAVLGKDYGGAAGYFERAAQWDPALPGLDGNWGRAAFQAQQYAQALGPLSRALSAHPDDAGVRSMLVYAESMAKTGNTPVPSR